MPKETEETYRTLFCHIFVIDNILIGAGSLGLLATPMPRGSRPPQFKFNELFNEHFPSLFFSKVFCRVKTGEEEVNCY